MESDARVSLLNLLSWNITLYGPLIIIVIGTIGCVCNFITFTSIKLRKNSCSFYFFVAAIFDLLTLDFGALTRLLGDHFGLAVYHQLQVYCKIRQYLVNILPALATLFIVLAAMDRFVSTSSKLVYRSWATIPYARRIAMISSIIWMASYLHYPFQAELRPTCLLPQGVYGTFAVVYSIMWTSIFPHALMLGFGYGTYYHICQTRRRAVAANSQQRRTYRTEKQLVTVSPLSKPSSSLDQCSLHRWPYSKSASPQCSFSLASRTFPTVQSPVQQQSRITNERWITSSLNWPHSCSTWTTPNHSMFTLCQANSFEEYSWRQFSNLHDNSRVVELCGHLGYTRRITIDRSRAVYKQEQCLAPLGGLSIPWEESVPSVIQ